MSGAKDAANEARMRSWFEKAWNGRDETALRSALGIGFQAHGIAEGPVDAEGFVAAWRVLFQSFGDLQVRVEDGVAADDTTAYRLTATGRHTGPGLGFEATGKGVAFPFFAFMFWKEDGIAEAWLGLDMASVYRQLGARVV